MNRVINPYANKASSTTDSATRRLNEAIVRLVFPLSLTRKKRPLARLISIPSMMTMMRKVMKTVIVTPKVMPRKDGRRVVVVRVLVCLLRK